MREPLLCVLFVVIGFLSGGVMYSYIVPLETKGIDIVADSPDGNAGVWNVGRFAGYPLAGLCLLLDLAKGAVPVFIAWHVVDPASLSMIPIVVAPVIGHMVSPYRRKLSGKGITTAFGVMLGLVPRTWIVFAFLIIYGFFLLVVTVHPHELLSICACICLIVLAVILAIEGVSPSLMASCAAVALCVAIRAAMTIPPEEKREVLLFGRYRLHR